MIRPRSKERGFRILVLAVGDFLIAWGALFLMAEVRLGLPPDAITVLLFAVSLVASLTLSGFYTPRVTPRLRPSIVTALVIQAALVAIGSAALLRTLPRTFMLGVPLVELIALPLWRRMFRTVAPIRPRDTILIGEPRDVEEAVAGLHFAGDQRINVIGSMLPRFDELADPARRARLRDAEEVICVSPETETRVRFELLRIRGPRGFLMLASHADALLASRMLGWIGDQPLVEVAVNCGFGLSAAVKRGIDIAGSLLLMLVAAPVAAVVAIAIWLDDRGPILIRQKRVGIGGEPYGMWKFRSMRGPAEPEVDASRASLASARHRITRVGKLLRPYHLDELPQLLNVLVGDMSLVGPRPERPELVSAILRDVPDFDLRSLVRPGIAGLAQVSAEYDTRPEVKLRYDLMYMCGWSVWLDVRLMLRAVSSSLAGTGL